jgi:hypothetical protein
VARNWGKDRLVQELVKRGIVEPGAERSRDGLAYRDHGLTRALHLTKKKHHQDLLQWAVFTSAERYDEPSPLMRHGGVYIETRAADEAVEQRRTRGCPWPQTGGDLAPELVADLSRHAMPCLRFVRDLADLGRLLLADGPARRGEAVAHLVPDHGGGRLVRAFILAREMPDPELEALAREKLERFTGDPSYMEWFTHWAKEIAPLVEADLSDLYRRPAKQRRR